MRVLAGATQLDVSPGQKSEFQLEIVNTGDIIDGVTARIVGLPPQYVTSRPAVLPLFPDATGQLQLTVGLPATFPAGRHQLSVEVQSRQAGQGSEYVDVDLLVPQAPEYSVAARPQIARTRRSARFLLDVTNRGNVPLDVALTANDPERAVSVRIEPSRLTVEPGAEAQVLVIAKAPRIILGADLDRPLTIIGSARPVGSAIPLPHSPLIPKALSPSGFPLPGVSTSPAPMPGRELVPFGTGTAMGLAPRDDIDLPGSPPAAAGEDQAAVAAGQEPMVSTAALILRSRPWFTRGMLTAVILLAIIAGWAAVFLFGIGQVFKGDPPTKQAPASFFAGAATGSAGPSLAAHQEFTAVSGQPSGGTGSGPAPAALVENAPPAGALPKTGNMPAGLGGTIAGEVSAASDGQPVGRILVEALRTNADGTIVTVASGASQADGSYQISGLFPGDYTLRLSASGFRTVYYPAATNPAKATTVLVTTGNVTDEINAVITGLPAQITGSIDPGDTLQPVVATVSVRPLAGPKQGKTVASTKTAANGKYSLKNLPAPGDYQLVITAKGYQNSEVETIVDGGSTRLQPTILLGAGNGSIAGTVTDGSAPLGGVSVTTTVNGATLTSGTPTTGTVGHFVLGQLPTPATYVITFAAAGYGSVTVVVDLGPGENKTSLNAALVKGSGTVTGRLVDASGVGLGGAGVTVGGDANPQSTTTLTQGDVGAFTVSGLPVPGEYTLTFRLTGYSDTIVPVTLDGVHKVQPVTVTMPSAYGTITGVVTDSSGAGVVGAAVVATDGTKTWPVTSTAASGSVPNGGYVIDQLPAGVYTVTATLPAGAAQTSVLTVVAGKTTTRNFPIATAG